jgi:hypothetical protein
MSNRAHHRFKPILDHGPGSTRFSSLGEAILDASERSQDTSKFPQGVDAWFDPDFNSWFSAPMLPSRGLDQTVGDNRYVAGKPVGKSDFSKTFKDFGPKVHFLNMGIGADGLASVTINSPSQDFSYRDLQEFAGYLIKIADEMARIDRRQLKAEKSAAITTNSTN